MQLQVREVEVAEPVREYMGNLLAATRDHAFTRLGASPRAGVHLQRSSQALAALQGSPFVAPEHVKEVAPLVLSHRLLLAPNSPLSAVDLVAEILHHIPVPI
jgi:MoxR-like ATPase